MVLRHQHLPPLLLRFSLQGHLPINRAPRYDVGTRDRGQPPPPPCSIGASGSNGPAEITAYLLGVEIATTPSTPIDFGRAGKGRIGPTRAFTIINNGSGDLKSSSVQTPAGYSVVKDLCSTLGSGEKDTFVIRLDTESIGTKTGALRFSTNDGDEVTIEIPITGEVTTLPEIASNFFSGDATADLIVKGQATYPMSDFNLRCSDIDPATSTAKSSDFGYKLINAIKLAGFARNLRESYCPTSDANVALGRLNEFQRFYNLPESPDLNQETMERLDQTVFVSEQRDTLAQSKNWLCFDSVASAPTNDVLREHLAFLFQRAINVFPPAHQLGVSDCYSRQTFNGSIANNKVCAWDYWRGYEQYTCNLRDSFNVTSIDRTDYSVVVTTIHEHAHYIDGLAPVSADGAGTQTIDTTEFYRISYDLSTQVSADGWNFYRTNFDIHDEVQNKRHFFSYASGWYPDPVVFPGYEDYRTAYEDFAVCVGMYVAHGVVFRDYMQDKAPLKQKYEWLRDNLFSGREFDTGDPGYTSYSADLSEFAHGSFVDAAHFFIVRPNTYAWDYAFWEKTK